MKMMRNKSEELVVRGEGFIVNYLLIFSRAKLHALPLGLYLLFFRGSWSLPPKLKMDLHFLPLREFFLLNTTQMIKVHGEYVVKEYSSFGNYYLTFRHLWHTFINCLDVSDVTLGLIK